MTLTLHKESVEALRELPHHDPVTVLLVEDSETDAYAVMRILSSRMPYSCNVIYVGTLAEAEQALLESPDIQLVLLDLGLPDASSSREVYARLEVFKERVPIVILTGLDDPELAVDMLGIGAQDYVCKQEIINTPELLARTIQFALGRHSSFRKSQQRILRKLEEKDSLLSLVTGSYSVMQEVQ
ncbi:MAG: response regulator [Pseudobdellovibrionaceae bacterium]